MELNILNQHFGVLLKKLLTLKLFVMENKYKQIEFSFGINIESAITELTGYSVPVCGAFNGKMLYSDIDDIDSAYKKITGKTKSEFDAEQKKQYEEYEKEERIHRESIPKLTEEWIDKGQKIIDDKYIQLWKQAVPIRLGDLYHGIELGCCLDIVKELNNGCELQAAKQIIESQGHSGMSFGLVCSMVRSFCDRGEEFVNFVK